MIYKTAALDVLGKYEEGSKLSYKASNIDFRYASLASNNKNYLSNFGKYSKDINSYDKDLKINSNDFKAWFGKGSLFADLYGLRKLQEAIKCYDKVIEIDLIGEWGRSGN